MNEILIYQASPWPLVASNLKKILVVGWWPVGLQCQPQSQSLSSGLWTLDLGL